VGLRRGGWKVVGKRSKAFSAKKPERGRRSWGCRRDEGKITERTCAPDDKVSGENSRAERIAAKDANPGLP